MHRIEIPLNKTKLLFGIIGSALLMLLGFWMFIQAEEIARTSVFFFFQSPFFNRIISGLAILIFGWVVIYGIKKMNTKSIGLIIDNDGIRDNSGILSVGLIKWNDITEIKTATYGSSRFLLIFVKEPNQFLENVKGFKRKMMQGNMNTYGTPVSISPNALKCNFNELEKILQERLSERQNETPNR